MLKPKGLGQDTLIGLSCGGADSISIYAARRSHFHFRFHCFTKPATWGTHWGHTFCSSRNHQSSCPCLRSNHECCPLLSSRVISYVSLRRMLTQAGALWQEMDVNLAGLKKGAGGGSSSGFGGLTSIAGSLLGGGSSSGGGGLSSIAGPCTDSSSAPPCLLAGV